MIVADGTVFPNNAVDILATRLALIDPDVPAFRRQLKKTDPVQAFGVYANQWAPDSGSYEIGGPGLLGVSEPTISVYSIGIQAYVKDSDDERGLAAHAYMAKLVRTMLYRDLPLHVALHSLQANVQGSLERTSKVRLASQRYMATEIDSQWLRLSVLDLRLETELS